MRDFTFPQRVLVYADAPMAHLGYWSDGLANKGKKDGFKEVRELRA